MPWHEASVCSGCRFANAGQAGEPFVPLRVVLHRARAERIEVRVDRHVPRRQVDEVADQVDLADLRQRRRRVGQAPCGSSARAPAPARRTPAADGSAGPAWLSSKSSSVDWLLHVVRISDERCTST